MDKELLKKKGIIYSHMDKLLTEDYSSELLDKIQGIKKWVMSNKVNSQIFLFGTKGTGKSFVAETALIEALKNSIPSRRIVWNDLVGEIQENYNQFPNKYHYDKVLFIDNFKKIDSKAYQVALSYLKMKHEEGVKLVIAMTVDSIKNVPIDFRDTIGSVCIAIGLHGPNLNEEQIASDFKEVFGGK